MSNVVEMPEMQTVQADKASSMALMLDAKSMESAMAIAEVMASSKVTVPKHLQGSKGDCMAIVLQSMNWGMNPFVVAQKTHIVNGALGYEAQLVNAVVQSQGFIAGAFQYEYQGTGEALECRVGAVLRGQKTVTWGEWLKLLNVTVRNSPLWKSNVKQQMGYLQVKNWARAYTPQAILGVYTPDELENVPPKEIDVTGEGSHQTKTPEPTFYTNDEFEAKKASWKQIVSDGKKDSTTLISFVESKGKLFADAQKTEINTWKKIEVVEAEFVNEHDDFLGEMEAAEQGDK